MSFVLGCNMAALDIFYALFFVLITNTGVSFAGSSLGRGFGDNIDWKTLSDGQAEAKESYLLDGLSKKLHDVESVYHHKPVMVIIHKSWCGACKALKPRFAESEEIKDLSKNFVMVNLEDDEEPEGTTFSLDGAYIPRIFFLDSAGRVQKDIYNEKGNPSYKYYYSNAQSIVTSMKSAMTKIINGVRIDDEL